MPKPNNNTSFGPGGFEIAPPGKGRNLIQRTVAKEFWRALQQLGRIEIKVVPTGQSQVIYSDKRTVFQIAASSVTSSTAQSRSPFTIYQSSTWLKYKVATGYVIKTGNPITPTAVETEFTLTEGVGRYWFYIDMSDNTVKKSVTTLTWSVDLIPLGWVDTDTGSASSISTPYQFVRDHIFIPCAV